MSKIWLLIAYDIELQYSTTRTLAKFLANKFEDDFEIIYIEELVIGLSNNDGLYITNIKGEKLEIPKIVLSRIDSPLLQFDKEIILLRHLEMMGAHIINSIESMLNCANKVAHLQILLQAKLPIADTLYATNAKFKEVITHPDIGDKCVTKQIRGSLGNNLFLSLSKEMLKDISGCLDHTSSYLFQEYIKYSHGKSIRVSIVDNIITEVSQFQSIDNNLKSNIRCGGAIVDKANIPIQAEELALKATSCLGLDIAGVDLLFKEDGGFVVCEVNMNPCFISNDYLNSIKNIVNMVEKKLILSGSKNV